MRCTLKVFEFTFAKLSTGVTTLLLLVPIATFLEARTLNNIGLAYAGLKQPDKAIFYYEQSLAVSTRSKNFKMITITTGNLSVLFNDRIKLGL